MRVPTPSAETEQERSGLFAFVRRRESQVGAQYFGQNIQIDDAPVLVEPQGAPDPIRQSMFSTEGRAPSEQHASVPVAIHLNLAGIWSVMQDNWFGSKVYPQRLTLMTNGGGGQAALPDRQVIDRPASEPYGGRAAVPGTSPRVGLPIHAYDLTYNPRRRM